MPINNYPRHHSELDAYWESSRALSDVYAQPPTFDYREAIERETAIQIARLTHHLCTREYLEARDPDEIPESHPTEAFGGGVEGLARRLGGFCGKPLNALHSCNRAFAHEGRCEWSGDNVPQEP